MKFEQLNNSGEEIPNNPEGKVIEGVDSVFEYNPELETIGTPEQYSEYIDTIFPDSTIKDIVWHYSDAEFKDEAFKPVKPNFDTLNSIEGIYNFSSNENFVKRYGKNPYAVVLDVHNPLINHTTGEYIDDLDRPLSEALYKIGKQKETNFLAPQYDETLKDTDAVVNHISGEEYVEKHPVSGREFGLPKQMLVSVFNPSHIHILGSKSDIEGFKSFVSKD